MRFDFIKMANVDINVMEDLEDGEIVSDFDEPEVFFDPPPITAIGTSFSRKRGLDGKISCGDVKREREMSEDYRHRSEEEKDGTEKKRQQIFPAPRLVEVDFAGYIEKAALRKGPTEDNSRLMYCKNTKEKEEVCKKRKIHDQTDVENYKKQKKLEEGRVDEIYEGGMMSVKGVSLVFRQKEKHDNAFGNCYNKEESDAYQSDSRRVRSENKVNTKEERCKKRKKYDQPDLENSKKRKTIEEEGGNGENDEGEMMYIRTPLPVFRRQGKHDNAFGNYHYREKEKTLTCNSVFGSRVCGENKENMEKNNEECKKRIQHDQPDTDNSEKQKKMKEENRDDEMDEGEMICVRELSPVSRQNEKQGNALVNYHNGEKSNVYQSDGSKEMSQGSLRVERDQHRGRSENDVRFHCHDRPKMHFGQNGPHLNENESIGPSDCPYSHKAQLPRKMKLCKFYLTGHCAKRDKCLYLHSDFPCKYYHTGLHCDSKDNCKFAHGKPLSDNFIKILLKHIESDTKEIFGDFLRVTREKALTMVGETQKKLQQQYKVDVQKSLEPNNVCNEKWCDANDVNTPNNNAMASNNMLNAQNFNGILSPKQISDLAKLGVENLDQISQLTIKQLNQLGLTIIQINEIQLNIMKNQDFCKQTNQPSCPSYYNNPVISVTASSQKSEALQPPQQQTHQALQIQSSGNAAQHKWQQQKAVEPVQAQAAEVAMNEIMKESFSNAAEVSGHGNGKPNRKWPRKGVKAPMRKKRHHQNKQLCDLLTPKNALTILNELAPGSQRKCTVTAEVDPRRASVSKQYVAVFTVNGVHYRGLGSTKLDAKNSAAENVVRDMMIKQMGGIPNTEPQTATPEPFWFEEKMETNKDKSIDDEPPFSMIHLASYALHKMFDKWQTDGFKVPLPGAVNKPESILGRVVAAAPADLPKPKKTPKLPPKVEHLHPYKLLSQMRPGSECTTLTSQRVKSNHRIFTMGIDVDGTTFIGKATTKKKGRRLAAKKACEDIFGIVYPEGIKQLSVEESPFIHDVFDF